jgi:hypothetical protein
MQFYLHIYSRINLEFNIYEEIYLNNVMILPRVETRACRGQGSVVK